MSVIIKNKISRFNLCHLIALMSVGLISSLFPQDLDNIKIGLVHSSLTKNLLHAEDTNFYPARDWELFFLNKKISYEVFNDEALDDYEFDEVDVLILPSIEILSNDGFENLKDFLNEGKRLFILGQLGVQDDDGNNRQDDLLQSLGGFQVNEFLDRNLIAKNHTLYANNFLTHNLQINTSLILLNNFQLLYTENTSGKIIKLGEYTDNDETYDNHLKSGIAMVEKEKGRLIWFGFQLSQISVDDDGTEALQKLIFNSIEWLAGKPIAWVNPLPANINSATIFTSVLVTPNTFTDKETEPFKTYSAESSFFLSPSALKSFPGEVERLDSFGDIHVLYDEFEYLDFSQADKIITLENAVQTLRSETRQSLHGIKYLNGNRQKNNFEKSVINSFDFLTYEDNSIISSEKKRGLSFNNIKMIFPPFNFTIQRNNFYRNNELADYKEHFNNVQKYGGIMPVIYMNQNSQFNSSIDRDTFKKILNHSRNNSSWVTTYSEIVDWLISKENISVNIKEIGEKPVISLVIENRNKDRVENVGVRLILPEGYRNPAVLNRNFSLRYDALTRSYFILVPILLANQSTTVEVHYDN